MLISHSGKSGFSSGQRIFMLNDLLLVPTASKNLLSVYQFFIDTNVFLEFDSLSVRVKDVVTKEMLLEGNQENGLYQLPVKISRGPAALLGERTSNKIWHFWLGHLHQKAVDQLARKKVIQVSCKDLSCCN